MASSTLHFLLFFLFLFLFFLFLFWGVGGGGGGGGSPDPAYMSIVYHELEFSIQH